ncbi:multidrug effflux MFS transporter [Pseudomonas sp. VI4.1]|jgi:DHA1 family bicyclomycin/chloramphenicol resistance-like MFS transporter|uniref:multidrug effflux MFS transporter n=1 Tax=Pseudomonas sp. VI4.1 TaxID=1941346 RepID=UPI0009C8192A|nr:multidrug effflux MFS transporter [Pseudomonas sp. VI4.1]OPK07309.1 multidrug transporter CflA [Pseudomonas sp. VI4.1]
MDEGKPAASVKHRRAMITLLLSMVVLGVFPLDVLLPSFPALAEHFRTTPSDIAFSISLFAVGIAFSQLLVGPLSDVIGRKSLLLVGMAVSMIGATGCVLSTDYAWFLMFRVIQAAGCGCFVLSQALVQDLFDGKERDKLRILMITTSGIFISVSPLVGTLLQQALDWPASFIVFIALAAAVFLRACFLLESEPPATTQRRSILQSYRRACYDAGFLGYWLIAAIAFACHFSFIVISPLIFMEQLQLSAYEFSLTLLLYGAAYIIGGIVARTLAGRIASNTQTIVGLSLIFYSGLVMLVLSSVVGLTILTVLIPMIICTAGTTIARPVATSKAMEIFPDMAGTSASVGNTMIFIVGGLISALINLSPIELQLTLAFGFIVLSSFGLVVSRRIRLRNPALSEA